MALRQGLIVLPIVLLALASPSARLHVAVGGVALFCIITALSFLGGAFGRAVAPGLMAGAVPLVVPLVLRVIGHGCSGMTCCLEGQCTTCLVVCVGAGLVSGAVLAMAALTEARDSRRLLASAAAVSVIAGSLGCVIAGASGVLGMVLGTLAASTPILISRRAS